MIYHLAIGNQYLHKYSNCTTISDRTAQCNDEDPHTCLESKLKHEDLDFPFNDERTEVAHEGVPDEIVHCQSILLFHNRINTCHDVDAGDRNGYWFLFPFPRCPNRHADRRARYPFQYQPSQRQTSRLLSLRPAHQDSFKP